jgi:hypothetical protein
MARAVICRSLTAEANFSLRSVYVRFVADKVALGRVFLRVLCLYPVNTIPQEFRIY